mgnify:CR=1 FL=1
MQKEQIHTINLQRNKFVSTVLMNKVVLILLIHKL